MRGTAGVIFAVGLSLAACTGNGVEPTGVLGSPSLDSPSTTMPAEPSSISDARALAEGFLGSRVRGFGAEGYIAPRALDDFAFDGPMGLYDALHGEGAKAY